MTRRPRGAQRATVGAALLAALSPGASGALSAERVHVASLGPGAALASSEGLDGSNSYCSRAPFPAHAELTLRTRVPGGIGQAPASDDAGNLIIAHVEPRLSKIDGKGRTSWTERLPSEANSAPVLLNDGSILIVTHEAEALLFSSAGKLIHRNALPFSDPRHRTLTIATTSGGALVVSGNELAELDAAARVVRRAQLRGTANAVLEAGDALLTVSESGVVERAHTTGDFELVGSFGGKVIDGAAVQAGKVLALVDTHKWLALDLASGQVSTLAVDAASILSGPAALLGARGAALIADGGFVSERDRAGVETLRIAIGAGGASFETIARGPRSARMLADGRGALLVAPGGNDALLLLADGSAVRFEGTNCLDPLRPTPTSNGVVLSCRSGQLFTIAAKAP